MTRRATPLLFGLFALTCGLGCGGVDPTTLEDCRGLSEADAYACSEARFWVAFQTRRDLRIPVYEMYGDVLDAHAPGDPALAVARGNVFFRRGQLGMAITLEEDVGADAIDYITRVGPDFEEAEALDPDNFILVSWKASMAIAVAHITGDDAEAVRLYDEAERRIAADPLGNVPSISGTAIGLPLSTGVPQRVIAAIDAWECTGADFCERNTEHAPWALPGMAYHWAEHYARVGDRDTTVAYLEVSRDAEGFERWPWRYLVDDALADPDALLARFAERGEEGSAFDLMYANQDYGCVICHAP
ncbi:MAG: hypothetical protein SangKO_028450 [Sandaracinaceae bacterium]